MSEHLPPEEHFLGKTFPFFRNHETVEHIGTGAIGRVYRAHAAHIDGDLAFKFVPIENLPSYQHEPDVYLEEARKANVLENPCVVPYLDVRSWEDPVLGREFVVFIREYVRGTSLEQFIRDNRGNVELPFIEQFLSAMFGLLFELEQRGMVHGDIHADNVLVTRSRYDLGGDVRFRVMDFKPAGHGDPIDYLGIARSLKELLECVSYQELPLRDRYVFEVLRNDFLGRYLVESDPTADDRAFSPRELQSKLDSVDEMFAAASASRGPEAAVRSVRR